MWLGLRNPICCVALCLGWMVTAPACGGGNTGDDGGAKLDGGGGGDTDGSGGGSDGSGGGKDDGGVVAALDLTGTWAAQVINSQIFENQILGKATVSITSLTRVELTQTGKTATAKSDVCSIALSPYKGNQTVYPQAAIAAIPEEMGTATLSDAAIGATYTPQRRIQLVGWHAKTTDAEHEAVPKDKSDARVYDADMDNHPGVTLKIEGGIKGEVYVVNRSIIELKGTIESKDRIKGSSHTVQEQVVLDANPSLLKSEVKTTPNPDASASTYMMVRTAAGHDTCEAIKAEAGTLFK